MTEEKYGDSYGEKFRKYEDTIKKLQEYNKKLLQSNIDQHNKNRLSFPEGTGAAKV